ncbi:PepSY domain-containing protein [Pendulispora rubella]|uniref:PepSY domain-containing protein n=1 Tax=Pendulispora rubella TaxID=2741070 RepID=A0ABZ2L775_9BACT
MSRFVLYTRKLHFMATAILGVQLVAWALTGFAFTLFDFRVVRGTDDRAPVVALDFASVRLRPGELVPDARDVQSVRLKMLDARPVYEVSVAGEPRLIDAADGTAVSIDEARASRIAAKAYRGDAHARGIERQDDDGKAVWVVHLDDARATDVAVDATTGDIAWWRNGTWRAFDVLWSIHVLGYVDRHSPAHWPLRIVGFLAAMAAMSGAGLLLSRLVRRFSIRKTQTR